MISPCHQVRTGAARYRCTPKLNAAVGWASGWNQTSWPSGATIIGPACPGPESGEMKMSPSDGSAAGVVTVTAGGCRSCREWNRVTFVDVTGTGVGAAGWG